MNSRDLYTLRTKNSDVVDEAVPNRESTLAMKPPFPEGIPNSHAHTEKMCVRMRTHRHTLHNYKKLSIY